MGVTGGYWAVLEVRPDQRIRAKQQVTEPPVLTFPSAENAGSIPVTRSTVNAQVAPVSGAWAFVVRAPETAGVTLA